MHHKINSFLEKYFQIRIIQSYKPTLEIKKRKSGKANIIVEFIGPSGVGKTTLCNYYLKNRKIETAKEVKTISDVNKIAENISVDLHEIDDFYHELCNVRIKSLGEDNSKSGGSKLRKLMGFFTIFKREYAIQTYLENKMVFMDEHLLLYYQNFPNHLSDSPNISDFLKNRIYIVCSTSKDRFLSNLEKRKKAGNLANHHKEISSQQLAERFEKSKLRDIKRSKQIQNLGGNVLSLDTGEGLDINCKEIDNYIQDFLKLKN